ncbi:hypothetical protein As57867_003692, partial [Aphanomyces stellatus]
SRNEGWVKAASSWGNVCGHILFAVLGDVLGRKRVYGYELVILVAGALLCAVAAWPINNNPDNVLIMLAVWRFLLGIGIGGDYPVSAVLTSEFASSDRRGQYIAAVFAMQGFGIITGALMAILVLVCFQHAIIDHGATHFGFCWRILAGFGAVPALAAVYWRMRIPETPRFTADVLGDYASAMHQATEFLAGPTITSPPASPVVKADKTTTSSYGTIFRAYFAQWINLKVLIGCSACWFFLDIGYYGTTLNTPKILEIIGFGSPSSTGNRKMFDDLWNRAVGTVIINLCGTVPGYWFTVIFVDRWGRKPIQHLGFAATAMLFLVLALWYTDLVASHRILFVLMYALAQFFFNFGPNATTFIIPAEVFPTAVRLTGHGIAAASGKLGAILSAQCFGLLAGSTVGFQGVLYIFAGCSFVGLLFSAWVPETMGQTLEELSGTVDQDEEMPYLGFRA